LRNSWDISSFLIEKVCYSIQKIYLYAAFGSSRLSGFVLFRNFPLHNRMIKRESGENPELSCSCKSHIRANMTSLRFLGRRLPPGDKSEDLPFALSFKAP